MDIAKRLYGETDVKMENFTNPKKAMIILSQQNRIAYKEDEFNIGLTTSMANLDNTTKLFPTWIKQLLTNLFLKPTYNLSIASDKLMTAEQKIEAGKELHNVYKYNSAVMSFKSADADINDTNFILMRELSIARKINWLHILMPIILIMVFCVVKFRSEKRKRKLEKV